MRIDAGGAQALLRVERRFDDRALVMRDFVRAPRSCSVSRSSASPRATSGATGSDFASAITSRSSTIGICAQIAGGGSGERDTAWRSSMKPTPFVATIGITGTPSFSRSAMRSMTMPLCSATSTMFSATTTGICSSSICATR